MPLTVNIEQPRLTFICPKAAARFFLTQSASQTVRLACCRLVVSPSYLVVIGLRLSALKRLRHHCQLFQQTIDTKVHSPNPFVFNEIAIIEGF